MWISGTGGSQVLNKTGKGVDALAAGPVGAGRALTQDEDVLVVRRQTCSQQSHERRT